MNSIVKQITDRIKERSAKTRTQYLAQMKAAEQDGVIRKDLACGNLAHAFAACAEDEKMDLSGTQKANLAIITAYNDMLSAHKTYEYYPEQIRQTARRVGSVAQVASGVPAMCDGVTQGQLGMELSLFSRDIIALSTAIGMSHAMFDGGLCLGICDKIVPGMMIGALRFGHLPFIFVPGGPMESGITNEEKAAFRRDYAAGKIGREELLKAESASYHSAGTCTFYGTANSNQMLMEIMGIHLPGASFVTPGTPLRTALTDFAVERLTKITKQSNDFIPMYEVITEESIVNALVGLLSTGGSTNHTLHIVAIARAAGIIINWEDFSDLSEAIPQLTKVYPNGNADINHFQACGGMGFLMKTLREGGYLNENVTTIMGKGLEPYTKEPFMNGDRLEWRDCPENSLDETVLRSVKNPFAATGGLRIMNGNIGRSVIKSSAVKDEHLVVTAPAAVFDDQDDVIKAFKRGELNRDVIVVVKNQGAQAIGMPELHKLTPTLSLLLNQGYKIALVTDGRMSGASGKVPSAIHLSPEAAKGGLIAKLEDGDIIEFNGQTGELNVQNFEKVNARPFVMAENHDSFGVGRELFNRLKPLVSESEEGASFII
ncbi:MAG: phosphogluconate dehydratase [Salibacteraceae bacterium]|nr:phosphogluconate dehydratase [Salibacteraceae bacterium]MDP4763468.1 phosphogluconate dehydratase [Salibacteraceae bacterium]MDP4934150.1 phosphogluconate dehydratase [Salibacteraceae bacterium]MDP4964090.1 phosphogluconate dehydratase [Salibacteraceae bacterium]